VNLWSFLLALIVFAVGLVVRAEYGWWGSAVARLLVRVAAVVLPERQRELRRAEWDAELDVLHQRQIPGVLYALGAVLAGAQVRLSTARDDARCWVASRLARRRAETRVYVIARHDLVRSTFLGLALLARAANLPTVQWPDDEQWATRLRAAHAASLRPLKPAKRPPLREAAVAAEEILSRQTHPTRSILHGLRRTDTSAFLARCDRMLAEPLRRIEEDGGEDAAPFRASLDALHIVLLDIRSYEDYDDLLAGRAILDERRDEQAVKRYRELLESVFDSEVVGQRVDELRGAFKKHGAIFAG
jgi:hypothetical protein